MSVATVYEKKFWPNGKSQGVSFRVEQEMLPSGKACTLVSRSDVDPEAGPFAALVVLPNFPLEIVVECVDGIVTVRATRQGKEK